MHVILKATLLERKTLSILHNQYLNTLLCFIEEGENKSYLDPLIMNLLALLVKDLEFGESTIEVLSKVSFYLLTFIKNTLLIKRKLI